MTFGKLYNPNKTKTFFFYNMEWRKLIQGQTLNQTVPLPSTYGGDFSNAGLSVDQLHAPAVCQMSAAIQAQFASAGQALSGCTDGAPDPAKQVAFSNNVIPASLLDRNAQALLTAGGKYGGIFPAPTNGTQFQGGNNLPTNVREEIVRIDENVSDKFTIYGHFVAEQVSQNYGTTMWSGDNVPYHRYQPSAILPMRPLCIPPYVISPNVGQRSFLQLQRKSHRDSAVWAWSPRLPISPSTDSLPGRTSTTASRRSTWLAAPDRNTLPTGLRGTTPRTTTSFVMTFPGPRDGISSRWAAAWMLYKKVQDWFQEHPRWLQLQRFLYRQRLCRLPAWVTANNYYEDAVKSTGHWNNVSWALYIQDNYRVNQPAHLEPGTPLGWHSAYL